MRYFYFTLLLFTITITNAQRIAVLQYSGGGDWYSNPTSLPNLIKYCNEKINTTIEPTPQTVTPNDIELFNFPMLHMTGHGNVFFSEEDAKNLQDYMLSGGFLHIDDNYGLDEYLHKELSKVFPNKKLQELPVNHPIFRNHFSFPQGLPKIHEHNNTRPQAFGFFHENRLVLLYTYESDLGDGWENSEVHNDPEEVRLKALQMGANIVKYVFEN